MTLEEFRALVAQARRERPIWFALDSDRPATEEEIAQAERELASTLPEQYRSFVKEFGGGIFAFANVLSVQPDSELNIVDFNRRDELIGSGFVAVSDPHTGDRYGFRCEGKTCRSEVWVYDHDDRQWSRTPFNDLFEFLQKHALASLESDATPGHPLATPGVERR
jgi:hypothetical protein